jgi:sugar phosphate isomerase/epimerase
MPLGVTAVMLSELTFEQQIALCCELGVTHYCVRPRIIPTEQVGKPYSNWGNHAFDLTPQRLVAEAASIKKQLNDAGLTVFGSVPAVQVDAPVDELKLHFEGAAAVGAGRVRVAPRNYPKGPFNYENRLEEEIELFVKAVDIARPYAQKIVMETHCGSFVTSPGLALNVCKAFSPDELGVIFDIANFNFEGSVTPNLAIAVLNDYIDHIHIGGMQINTTGYDANGFAMRQRMMAPLTDSNLYLPDWIKALVEAGITVPMLIEDYTLNKPGALRLREASKAIRRVLESL